MKFRKIYIEITNNCNFGCSFCFKSDRQSKFMSVDEFQLITEKIRPFTDYIYLHVLGEPLLHPRFDEILTIAENAKLNVNITTNGSLINRKKDILLRHNIRQVNISLHVAEENIGIDNAESYIESIFDYALAASEKTYISLRLWNSGEIMSYAFNKFFTDKISEKFKTEITTENKGHKKQDIKLADHIYLQSAPRFGWPDGKTNRNTTEKTCYALRDHIAILSDGTVVPCCLDADANISLGNIYMQELDHILNAPRAVAMKKGFEQHKIVESFCKSCGFIIS